MPASGVNRVNEVKPEYAVLGYAYMTAYGAVVNSAQITPGTRVTVIGTGGVGLAIVDVTKALGAEVIAVGRSKEKLEIAKKIGAKYTVSSLDGDVVKAVKELTDGHGSDVVIEAVGVDKTVDQAVEMVTPGGKVVLVGLAPMGHRTPIHLARAVRGGVTIIGSYGARPRIDFRALYYMVKRGLINPFRIVNRYYKLDDVNETVEALRSRRSIRPVILF